MLCCGSVYFAVAACGGALWDVTERSAVRYQSLIHCAVLLNIRCIVVTVVVNIYCVLILYNTCFERQTENMTTLRHPIIIIIIILALFFTVIIVVHKVSAGIYLCLRPSSLSLFTSYTRTHTDTHAHILRSIFSQQI